MAIIVKYWYWRKHNKNIYGFYWRIFFDCYDSIIKESIKCVSQTWLKYWLFSAIKKVGKAFKEFLALKYVRQARSYQMNLTYFMLMVSPKVI